MIILVISFHLGEVSTEINPLIEMSHGTIRKLKI